MIYFNWLFFPKFKEIKNVRLKKIEKYQKRIKVSKSDP